MAALIQASKADDYPADIVLVISNKANAGGIEKARVAGIPTAVIDHRQFGTREDFDRAVHAAMTAAGVEIICMAGFMRIVSPWFATEWSDRLLNIHPALLPSYTGLHTHARALKDGVKIHGCTVHFVRSELDVGPIIVQAAVPVFPEDDEQSLAARVLAQEHRIYPAALAWVASGQTTIQIGRDGGEQVHISNVTTASAVMTVPAI